MTPEEFEKQVKDQSNEEMERLAFLGTLAEGLAHEIRNPLSTINVNLQLLKEDCSDPENDRQKKMHEKVNKLLEETERLEGVLNNFLEFAKGKDLELEDLDLNNYLNDVLDFFEPKATKEQVEIRREFETGLPLVSIDPSQFRQALLNIFRNTLEAFENGSGVMSVKTDEKEDGSVLLTVVDNGSGIPSEKLDKVFEVYYSTKKGGTGLGLPIAKRIVNEHGGDIKIESELNEGTSVCIILPPASEVGNQI